ncbi:hypothetical protein [uncultured Winogradskyella sp.]|uniref:hypothetical protein n=1 Tax=uncultured Winogradskyella sp. TaxID=395353 RepID=UPI002601A51D|nr:hypothetical protein [uncultured Winogradskyella sp.]
MKTYFNILMSIFMLTFSIGTLAQELPNVVPPSPEAAELIKYSQTEVSPYTGLPSISIPFYTISHKGVSVPIGLGYSGGGIKVTDIASWAGLGWNLQAGGLVSRTIRGLPDDSSLGCMNTPFTVEDLTNGNSSYKYNQLDTDNATDRDYQPDIFNFSLPGGSGQFFYDETLDEFVQYPKTNFIIESIGGTGRITGFRITDTQGIKYEFGIGILDEAREAILSAKTKTLSNGNLITGNTAFYSAGGTNAYYQTWMLTSIIFPNTTQKITFNYITENNVLTNIPQGEDYVKPGIHAPTNVDGNCFVETYNQNYLEKTFAQPKIESIEFPKGKVLFQRGTSERSDLNNSYPLEYIKLLDNDGKLIRQFKLNTSYFISPNDENPFFDVYNEGQHRLRLDSISQYDKNSVSSIPYIFEYNAVPLPDRFSRSQDYFGYYNGKSNTSLIPKSRYTMYNFIHRLGDADRSIDPNYTQACILKKITFPTGGYEEFVWENNFIQQPNALSPEVDQYVDHLIKSPVVLQNSECLFGDSDPDIDFSTQFTLDVNSTGWVDFQIAMDGCPGPDLNLTTCAYKIRLEGVDTPYSNPILQSDFELELLPGKTYKITAESNTPITCYPCQNQNCTIGAPRYLQVVANHYTDPTPNEFMYGGLRIKEVNTYSDQQASPLSRSYDYNLFGGNQLTSGKTIRFIDNFIDNWRIICFASPHSADILTFKLFSDNSSSMLQTKGSYVGYTNVTETFNGVNGTGYKEYEFSTDGFLQFEATPSPIGFTAPPIPNNFDFKLNPDWLNGNIDSLRVYDRLGTLVQKSISTYESSGSQYSNYFSVQSMRMPVLILVGGSIFSAENYKATKYDYQTEYHRLKSQTTTEYRNTGDITVTNDYYYDNNPLLASRTSTAHSSGHTQENHVTYVQDLQSPTTAEQELINQDRYETIQTDAILKNGNTILSQNTTKTVYHDWGSGRILPQIVQTRKGEDSQNNVFKDRIKFHSYDNYGNPKEVSKVDGTRIMYVWGYNETLPIAKIENASYVGISTSLNSAISAAKNASYNDDDAASEAALRDALEALRNHPDLQQAMVTTYTYDPLIGVTSMTDPKGYTVYYEYDDFNRLQRVKDQDGKIMSENKYNYHLQSNN